MQSVTSLLLNEIPAGTPPLFHYTDAGGLLGMLQYQKLWMTNVHYQNDEQEYNYAFKLLSDILSEYNSPELSSLVPGYSSNDMGPFYSFSLSEVRDSLSQWRGYCPNGGYAIAFTTEQLNSVMKNKGLVIGKCIYDKEEQRRVIIEKVIGFTAEAYAKEVEYLQKNPAYRMPSHMKYSKLKELKSLKTAIISLAPFLKHPDFSEEREWRLLKSSITESINMVLPLSSFMFMYSHSLEINFRTRKNMLIPYVEIPLTSQEHKEEDKAVRVHEIIVGPTPHKTLALEACKVLMYKINYPYRSIPKIENSAIPYVNW